MVGHHPTMFGDHIRIVVEVFSLSRDTIGNWNILVLLFNKMASETYSELCQTSKMEHFPKMVNSH